MKIALIALFTLFLLGCSAHIPPAPVETATATDGYQDSQYNCRCDIKIDNSRSF